MYFGRPAAALRERCEISLDFLMSYMTLANDAGQAIYFGSSGVRRGEIRAAGRRIDAHKASQSSCGARAPLFCRSQGGG